MITAIEAIGVILIGLPALGLVGFFVCCALSAKLDAKIEKAMREER
jgi:hypothetical protein